MSADTSAVRFVPTVSGAWSRKKYEAWLASVMLIMEPEPVSTAQTAGYGGA